MTAAQIVVSALLAVATVVGIIRLVSGQAEPLSILARSCSTRFMNRPLIQ